MASVVGVVRDFLESRGFRVSVDTVRVRGLLGGVAVFERVVGVVEGRVRVSWRYWPGLDRCEINVSVYGGGEGVAEELESRGVVVEVVDDVVYGKVRVRGSGVDKLREIVDVVHGSG